MIRAICRLCAHVNPHGARFCNECGAPLTLVACPECEAINALGAPLCHQCGTALDTSDVDLPVPVSTARDATSVPTAPHSGAPLQASGDDKTPIALAERFERTVASPRVAPTRRPTMASPVPETSRIEPARAADPPARIDPRARVEPYARVDEARRPDAAALAGERALADVPALDAAPALADDHLPEGARPLVDEPALADRTLGHARERLSSRRARRSRLPVAVVAIVVIGIAAGSYYGWLTRTSTRGAAMPAASPQNAAPASDASDRSSSPPDVRTETRAAVTAPREAPTSSPAASPAMPPSAPAASSPPAPAASPPPANDEAGSPPASVSPSGRASAPPPAPAASSGDRSAARTRTPPRGPRIDKDALATERLIERDLGKFLPR